MTSRQGLKSPGFAVHFAGDTAMSRCVRRFFPHAYLPLPCWRTPAKRASCQDMVNLLRKEVAQNPELVQARLASLSNIEIMCVSSAA